MGKTNQSTIHQLNGFTYILTLTHLKLMGQFGRIISERV